MSFIDKVPLSKPEKGLWKKFLWAFFGNDDDGLLYHPLVQGYDPSWSREKSFWKWWLRNPFHNFSYVVARRPVINPKYLIGKSEPFSEETKKTIVLRFNPFFLKLGYVFIGWRSDNPMPEAWGGKYGPGGGKFQIGAKNMN